MGTELQSDLTPHRVVSLSRLEALGDAIFGFSLTLLALDLRLPEAGPSGLVHGLMSMLPKLLIFVFAFLVIAQQWDVHQRTMSHVARADGLFVWLYLISLMFVVLMPASADILARYPLQPLALVFFGINTSLLCIASWAMWQHAARGGRLLDDDISLETARLIARLWLYPPIVICLTMPLGFISVYPVYALWFLMPVISYGYGTVIAKRKHLNARQADTPKKGHARHAAH